MKNTMFALMLLLIATSGTLCANHDANAAIKEREKPSAVAGRKAHPERNKWEASPDGQKYLKWQASAEGKKVRASYDRIKDDIKAFARMEAIVTSTTFQRADAKPSGPKWLIVKIDGSQYMMQFSPKDFKRFSDLKVNDRITVRSRSAGFSHNHPYLILSGDYIEQDRKLLFKRDFSKNKKC